MRFVVSSAFYSHSDRALNVLSNLYEMSYPEPHSTLFLLLFIVLFTEVLIHTHVAYNCGTGSNKVSAYGVHAFLEVNYKILQFSVTCGGGYFCNG